MKKTQIKVNAIRDVDTSHFTNQIAIVVEDLDLTFIRDLEPLEIIQNCNDAEKLFEAIIENDEEILHNYLTKNGYLFNKN